MNFGNITWTKPLRAGTMAWKPYLIAACLSACGVLSLNSTFAAADAASALVQKIAGDGIKTLSDKTLSDDERRARFRKIVVKNFDVPAVGRFVLGGYYPKATPDQQKRFLSVFEGALSDIYIQRLYDYDGQSIQIKGTKPGSGFIVVQSTISTPTGGASNAVDWLVEGTSGKELIIDVVVDGVSTSATTKDDYGSVLRASNGNVDDLISRLQSKAR